MRQPHNQPHLHSSSGFALNWIIFIVLGISTATSAAYGIYKFYLEFIVKPRESSELQKVTDKIDKLEQLIKANEPAELRKVQEENEKLQEESKGLNQALEKTKNLLVEEKLLNLAHDVEEHESLDQTQGGQVPRLIRERGMTSEERRRSRLSIASEKIGHLDPSRLPPGWTESELNEIKSGLSKVTPTPPLVDRFWERLWRNEKTVRWEGLERVMERAAERAVEHVR